MGTCCEGGERYYTWWLHVANNSGTTTTGGVVYGCIHDVQDAIPVGAEVSLDGYSTVEVRIVVEPAGSRR